VKTIDIGEASSPLAEYLEHARTEPLVFTDHGAPTAVILYLVNTDLETVALSTDPEFIALIERSRARTQAEDGLSTAEMRRRVLPASEEAGQDSIGSGVTE
jgi:PHD/YefM family antitoxin component YafN of YafNO toxin-antitoxin module